mmetsp:Transcript_20047/g.60738  ORF Transcript_20047/g.60738 Transcript_20047/m.60738 type:complete len:323 (-) Transcript_20047:368-1336(-)
MMLAPKRLSHSPTIEYGTTKKTISRVIRCASAAAHVKCFSPTLLLLAHLRGAVGGRDNGVHYGAAEAALLESVHAGDGGATGARDHILELARVLPRLEHHGRGAAHRLRGEAQRHVARQTGAHGAVGECLDEVEHEGRAGTGNAGHGVEELLLHLHDLADGAKDGLHIGLVLVRGRGATRVRGSALAHHAGRVRHDAHDARRLRQAGRHGFDGHARGNAHDAVVRREVRRKLVEDDGHDIRLHGDDDEVRAASDLGIAAIKALHAGQVLAKLVEQRLHQVAGTHAGGGDGTGAHGAPGKGTGHVARSDEAQHAVELASRRGH